MILASITCFLYLMVGAIQARSVIKRQPNLRLITLPIALIAIIGHTWLIKQSVWLDNGINLSAINIGSLISYCFIIIILLSSIRKNVDNLFLFLFPAAALWVLLSAFSPNDQQHINQFGNGILAHILLSLIAYAVLLISTIQAALLWLQNHQLRKHSLTGFSGLLPPLQSMELLLFDLILTGFILLSAAMISGIYFSQINIEIINSKTVLTLLAWCVYFLLLIAHSLFGWRGERASKLTILGFVILFIAFFGSRLIQN